jgi:WD40 repeat protein
MIAFWARINLPESLMRYVILAAAGLAALSSIAAGQRASKPPLPYQRAVFHSDSISAHEGIAASPDGKWIAFAGELRGHSSIWVVAASGGEVHRLTDGAHTDAFPVWFPSGDRVAFSTNRVRGIMTIGFDPARGTAVGLPKRITVEPTWTFDISPDGKQVVYHVDPGGDGKGRIRVASSSGGAAKTIYETADQVVPPRYPRFSLDGRTVYFTGGSRDANQTPGVMRVPVGGGPATLLPGLPAGISTVAYPRIDRVVTSRGQGRVLWSLAGDSIAMVPINNLSGVFQGFSANGQTMYLATGESDATVRLVSTSGGPTIDLTSPASGYAYPVGWTTDNRLFYTRNDPFIDTLYLGSAGSHSIRAYPLAPVNPPDGWAATSRIAPSGDGRSVLMRKGPAIFLLDLESRKFTEVSRAAVPGYVTTSDGISPRYFYFFEKGEHGLEVKSVRAGEQPKVVAILPNDAAVNALSLVGDRLVYRKQMGDSTAFESVRGTTEAPTHFAMLPGSVSLPVASPDGRWLAASAAVGSTAGGDQRVMFLPLGADGMPSGAPRFIPTDKMWDLAWTPDSRAVIGLEKERATPGMTVRRIPIDPKESVSTIGPTNATFWDAYLSPDGKYVAIPVERSHGSTIWAFDLNEAKKAAR